MEFIIRYHLFNSPIDTIETRKSKILLNFALIKVVDALTIGVIYVFISYQET
jgi:hypothetical protein